MAISQCEPLALLQHELTVQPQFNPVTNKIIGSLGKVSGITRLFFMFKKIHFSPGMWTQQNMVEVDAMKTQKKSEHLNWLK